MAYGALTIALLYTHYFSMIPIGIQQLAFGAGVWRRLRRGEPVKGADHRVLGHVGGDRGRGCATGAFHPPAAPNDQDGPGTACAAAAPSAGVPPRAVSQTGHPTIYALIANFVWAIWGYHANSTMLAIGALWPLLMLLALALLGRGRSPDEHAGAGTGGSCPLVLMAIGFKEPIPVRGPLLLGARSRC